MSLLMLALSTAGAATSAEGPRPTTWKLEDLYPTVEAFEAAKTQVGEAIGKLSDCEGKLGKDAATLLDCLERRSDVAMQLGRLSSYASNHAAADTRDDTWRGREDATNQLYTQFYAATAWAQPEIQALGKDKIEAFVKDVPLLAKYEYNLEAVVRRGDHVKSPAEERILALSGDITGRPGSTYDTFANAEVPWPSIKLPDGTTATLRQSEYGRLRAHPDAAVRRQVFDAFFGTYAQFEGTFGSLLASQMASHWFVAQARGYGSSVEASLAGDFIPRKVYDTLVSEVNANLPTLHRYLKLRKDMLGIDELSYSDLYVPLVASDKKFTFDESAKLAVDSAKPLGKDYVAAMQLGVSGGWIDAYPSEGKRQGAYMSDSAYGVHPFVLLNHNDDYESASTLAHEMGHAMHSQLAMANQPFPTAAYSTFLAEIASTFNEALLLDHQLALAKTDEDKLFYLGSALEGLRTTFYRQALFAEFELAIHEKVEKGEPLTGGVLTEMYGEILRRYYGADQGIVAIAEPETHEWAFIPHFYYNYYVYQYATSLAASSQLSNAVLHKEKGAADRYLTLLKAGGSDDPYELLKTAGVDLASPEPYRAVATRMNGIMDQIDAIRAKQAKAKAKTK